MKTFIQLYPDVLSLNQFPKEKGISYKKSFLLKSRFAELSRLPSKIETGRWQEGDVE